MLGVSELMTTIALNTKFGKVENKILVVSDLVKKQILTLKYQMLKKKYITTSDYNTFLSDILDAKLKKKKE